MISVEESLGLTYDKLFVTFKCYGKIVHSALHQLALLFKGRDTEKVFKLIGKDNTVRIEATAVISIVFTLATNVEVDDFEVVCVYKDLQTLIPNDSTVITIQVTPINVTFSSENCSVGLTTCNSIISDVKVPIVNTEPIALEETIHAFKKLIKLNTIYKDFPSNRSIYCRDNYAYVITPVAYVYIKGCVLETVLDLSIATFLVNLWDTGGKSSIILYSKQAETTYLRIGTTELYIPTSVLVPEKNSNKLLKSTKSICHTNADKLLSILHNIKEKCRVDLDFQCNTLTASVNNFDFTYANTIQVKECEKTTLSTDIQYLATILNIFGADDIDIREGENLLVLKSTNSLGFLSCLN